MRLRMAGRESLERLLAWFGDHMEKYGVTTTRPQLCPLCGEKLNTDTNPPTCPVHGSTGIEKKSEETDGEGQGEGHEDPGTSDRS